MLFPSTIIIGSDSDLVASTLENLTTDLGHKLTPNNPDILNVTDYSIESVKQIANFLSKKPYSHQTKIVIINAVHTLQTEAQNALLKILEEPGADNYFILSTSTPGRLVPTILSRCHQIQLSNSSSVAKPTLTFPSDIKSALLQSEKFVSDKGTLSENLQQELSAYHRLLIEKPSKANQLIIQKIIKALNMLNANVDPKSVLDYLFLS